MKSQIIEQLGQTDILLPSLIAEGLAANDRVKVRRLSVLQAAARHARDPHGSRFDLDGRVPRRRDRSHAAGGAGQRRRPRRRRAHHGARPRQSRSGDLGRRRNHDPRGQGRRRRAKATAAQRLSALEATASPQAADTLELAQVARLTEISGGNDDSLHRLVMDLHKALNRLSAAHAEEVLAGAHVYGLDAGGPPGGRSLHARRRDDAQTEVRSSRSGDHGGARRRAAHHPERYRRNRRACGGGRRSKPTR